MTTTPKQERSWTRPPSTSNSATPPNAEADCAIGEGGYATAAGECLSGSGHVASAEGKRTELFPENSLNLENSLKSEVRLPSSKETLQLRR